MEILHKAKRKDNGEWVEGFYCQLPKISLGATIIANGEMCAEDVADYIIVIKDKQHSNFSNGFPLEVVEREIYEIDPKTVCVYIGKTDKEGKKIFTGDIFMFPDEVWESTYTSCGTEWDSWEATNYGVVGYCDYSARFDFVKYKYNQNSIEADLNENNDLDFGEFVSGLIAVGNVFDNPELLERTV